MQKHVRFAICILAAMSLSACSGLNSTQQGALTGGAIGAATGIVLTAATGGTNLLLGGLVGGAGGAAIGASTH